MPKTPQELLRARISVLEERSNNHARELTMLRELIETPVAPAQRSLTDARTTRAPAPCGCHDNGGHTDPIEGTPESDPRNVPLEALTGLPRGRK